MSAANREWHVQRHGSLSEIDDCTLIAVRHCRMPPTLVPAD
jgi:hypothetical protein